MNESDFPADDRLPEPYYPARFAVAVAQDHLAREGFVLDEYLICGLKYEASWQPTEPRQTAWEVKFDPLPPEYQIEGVDPPRVTVDDQNLHIEGQPPRDELIEWLGDPVAYEKAWNFRAQWRKSELTIDDAFSRAYRTLDACPTQISLKALEFHEVRCFRNVFTLRGVNLVRWAVSCRGVEVEGKLDDVRVMLDERGPKFDFAAPFIVADGWTLQGARCNHIGQLLD